ncbi:hypothetical protein VKT23_018248 [Stygiomarasmius scandens]|uniref:NADH dehydrogenase subunit 6 n=1 Tax=Marasmiellus scandens TaxID=2682957 RepID=A0ABR1IRH5_9AGAR
MCFEIGCTSVPLTLSTAGGSQAPPPQSASPENADLLPNPFSSLTVVLPSLSLPTNTNPYRVVYFGVCASLGLSLFPAYSTLPPSKVLLTA